MKSSDIRRKFHQLRRVYMTLLETLIAVSLLSIVLVFVFGFFHELSEITRLTEISQKQSFQMRYLESRLGFIVERIVNDNETSRKFFFYTEPPNDASSFPSLILTFDNGVRQDPSFSGDVLGRLYIDDENNLRLAIWPLQGEDPHQFFQEEVLLENVMDIRYSFYAAPKKVKDKNEIHSGENIDPEKKTPKKGEWDDKWFVTYDQMPGLMSIFVKVKVKPSAKREKKEIDEVGYFFQFVLPSNTNYVSYPTGGEGI